MDKDDVKWLGSIAFSSIVMYLLAVTSIICFG